MKKKKPARKKLFLADRLYIPIKTYKKFSSALKESIKSSFRKTLRSKNFCVMQTRNTYRECELLAEDRNACSTCPSAEFKIDLVKKTPRFITVPRGDMGLIDLLFDMFKIVDRRTFPKLPKDGRYYFEESKLKDQKKLENQKKVVQDWIDVGYGIIKAPARSGKTIMAALMATKLKTKTIIITHQKELLDQFYNTFIKFTNIKEKEKLAGRRLIALNPKVSEVDDLSVCLYTYQHFISQKNGKKRLRELRKKFGFIVIDECHLASALEFSKVMGAFYAKYRLGLSATPSRKDQLCFRGDRIVGPVTVESKSEQMPCKVRFVTTDVTIPFQGRMNMRSWCTFYNRLSNNEERDEIVIKQLKKDLKKGHKVLIPVMRVAHTTRLAEKISKLLKVKATAYHGKIANRDKLAVEIRKGKWDVVVAMRKMLSVGFDAPPISCLYEIIPLFNEDNYYQEFSRIRTPLYNNKGKNIKKTPLIRVFKDKNPLCERFVGMTRRMHKLYGFKEYLKTSITSSGL